jgi:hypothetical protein
MSGLMHSSKNAELFRHPTTMKYFTDRQFET